MIALLFALATGVASAEEAKDLDFDLEGYYRTRGYMFKELFASPIDGPGEVARPNGTGKYMQQRLRLRPVISFEKRAKFTMMVDVLDDVVWGDNASKASTALFAGDPSVTGQSGLETSTFNIKRAWMEFDIPVGKVRVGRQPSQWGLGILGNDGNGFDDLFGENHGGSTFDRVLFATRPLAIVEKAMAAARRVRDEDAGGQTAACALGVATPPFANTWYVTHDPPSQTPTSGTTHSCLHTTTRTTPERAETKTDRL